MSAPDTTIDIEELLGKYPNAQREDLIPVLQDVQEAVGYISKDALVRIAQHLNLPASKVYGVATFYNQFRFEPVGRYHVQVCCGTARTRRPGMACSAWRSLRASARVAWRRSSASTANSTRASLPRRFVRSSASTRRRRVHDGPGASDVL